MANQKLMLINCEDAEKWEGFECVWDHFLSRPGKNDKWQYFNATQGVIPAVESVHEGDVMLLTGSHYGADQDLPWIRKLATALPLYAAAGVRIIACCFGHQLLALALGGKVGRNPTNRFVLRVEDIRCNRHACEQAGLLRPLQDALAEAGGLIVPDHLDPGDVVMQQIESHGDCVTDLPPGAVSLATSDLAPRLALEKILSGLRSSGRLTPEEADASETSLATAVTCPSGPATQDEEMHKADATERAAEAVAAVVPEGQVHPALLYPLLQSAPAFHKVLHYFTENGLALPAIPIPRHGDSPVPVESSAEKAAGKPSAGGGSTQAEGDQGSQAAGGAGQSASGEDQMADAVAKLAVSGRPAEGDDAAHHSKVASTAAALEQLISNARASFDASMQNTLVDYKQLSDMNAAAANNCSAAADKAKELVECCQQLKMQAASAQRALDGLPQLHGLLDQLGQVVDDLDAQSAALAAQVGVAPTTQPTTTSSMLAWASGSK